MSSIQSALKPEQRVCGCGGGGGGGYFVENITGESGTGFDPYTGQTVDVWYNYIVTDTYYLAYSGSPSNNSPGPTYFFQNAISKPACIETAATILGAAAAAARYIVQNAADFATITIKTGASALAATVFAESFIAAGAEVTGAAAALAFIAALIAGLPLELWLSLVTAVALLATIAVQFVACKTALG